MSRYLLILGLVGLLSACAKPLLKPPQAPAAAAIPSSVSSASDPRNQTEPEPMSAPPASPAPSTIAPKAANHSLQRLALELAEPQCRHNRVVDRWIERFQNDPVRWRSLWDDHLPLLNWVRAELRAAALPAEFALIPLVESHYDTDARNGSNAGMWQLAEITARGLGLAVGARRDQRLDPVPATRTAIRLLQTLMQRFDDWRLAAMAYNSGEFRLAKALQAMPAGSSPSADAHQPPGLGLHTYEYLAKIEAISCLIAAPDTFDVHLPDDDQALLTAVSIPHEFRSIGRLARIVGIDAARATQLNAASAKFRIDAETRQLLLPQSDAKRIHDWQAAVAAGRIQPVPPEQAVTHVVARGDSLWRIARKHRMSVRELKSWNALPDAAVLHPGQVLRLEP